MNNSFLAIESQTLEIETPVDNTVRFRQRENELLAIIEAFETILASKEWATLKEKVFDEVLKIIQRERDAEVQKQPLNGPKIHNLNGQEKWAKTYLDLSILANKYKLELTNIRKQMNAT